MTSNAAKNFDILTTNLSVLHNYLNDPTKLFSDLYLVKFLDILAKSFFFSCFYIRNIMWYCVVATLRMQYFNTLDDQFLCRVTEILPYHRLSSILRQLRST